MRNKLFISLSIIVLLVFYCILGLGYLKERHRQEVLSSQITDVTRVLAQTARTPQDIERELALAQASLAAEQTTFPRKPNSNQVINSILKLADDCQLRTSLVAQPWLVENVGKHPCYVLRIYLTVEGSFSQLPGFVSRLENGEFETLIVKDLTVQRTTGRPTGITVPEGDEFVTATLDVALYAQPVTSD